MTKNLLKALCFGSALILAGCSGCNEEKKAETKNENVEIKVGEMNEIKGGRLLDGNTCILYAGMNLDSTFSLADCSYNGANVYYPKSSKIINYQGKRFDVISVTPEKIVLKTTEENKK